MPDAPTAATRVAGRLDAACATLAGALAGWTAFVAGGGDGRSTPVVLLLAGLVAAVLAGRRLARWSGLVPNAVAAGVAGAFVLSYPGVLSAGGAPTGYANSNATLAAVGLVAAVASARLVHAGAGRRGWTALAAGLGAATLLTQSTAGIVVLVAAGMLWLLGSRAGWPPLVAAGGAVGVGLALAVTVAIAVDDSTPFAATDVARVDLWAAAADLAVEEPVRGLGAGAFEDRNPVTDDADLRWAHHEYLELGVELGGIGLLLAIALGLTVMARLAMAGADGTAAATAVTIAAAHGTVDHVWHAPVLLLVTALLVGDATAVRPEVPAPTATLGGRRRHRTRPEGHCR